MKKLLTCETTVLSLFLSLVLAVLTLSWQAHPQANPHQGDGERRTRRIIREMKNSIKDLLERMAERCRKDPRASNCGPLYKHVEVPAYGFSLILEEDRLVFRSSQDEWGIPIEDCPEYIEDFFESITASLMGEDNVHEIGPDAIEVHANGSLIFRVTPGSEFFTFIENLPHEVSSLEDRVTRGCEE